jgi:hypothetical protein
MGHQRPSTRPQVRFGRALSPELRVVQEAIRRYEAHPRSFVRKPKLHVKAGGMERREEEVDTVFYTGAQLTVSDQP